MNYEEMSDFEVNKEVAFKIRGRDAVCVIGTSLSKLVRIFNGNSKREEESGWVDFDPCNNPSDAWPIIVENGICLNTDDIWYASVEHPIDHPDYNTIEVGDKNPLRAAMICFLYLENAEKEKN